MKKFITYGIVTIRSWCRYDEKIFLVTEEGYNSEYFGTYSLSQLWLKAPKGRKICVEIIDLDGERGCLLVKDLLAN